MYETIKDYKADPYTLRIADNGDFIMDVLDNQNRKAGYLQLPFEKNIKNLAVWYARDLCIDIITAIGVLADLHNNKIPEINKGNLKSNFFKDVQNEDNSDEIWKITIYKT